MIRRPDEDPSETKRTSADDLLTLKQRLRSAERDVALDAVYRHPKRAILLAFAAGAAFAGMPIARRFIWTVAVWGVEHFASELRRRD